MSKDFPVRGLKELDAYLAALPEKMQKQVYRQALTAAAAPIRAEARLLARRQSGKMAAAIGTGSPRQNSDGTFQISVRLDPKKPHGFLGIFHEYGVRPHLISVTEADKPTTTKRDGRVVALSIKTINKRVASGSLVIGKHFVGPVVHHPGHSAHPFMRPALETKQDEAIAAFAQKIRDWLENKTGFVAPAGGE